MHRENGVWGQPYAARRPPETSPCGLWLGVFLVLLPLVHGCASRAEKSARPCPKCPATQDGAAASPVGTSDGSPGATEPDDAGAARPRRAQPFSLAAAAEGFRSHATCVAELSASLPPELTAEADPANLVERICQTRRALAEKSLSLCEEIQDAHWPGACRRLLGGLTGRPEVCPTLSPRSRGREPACLALASRDPSLCRAVVRPAERRRCQAILGPPGLCQALRTSADVSACERDRRRWRAVLTPGAAAGGPGPDPRAAPVPPQGEPELVLEVTAGGRTLPVRIPEVLRGVVVPWEARGRAWVSIGGLSEARPTGEERIRLVLEVPRLEEASNLILGPDPPGVLGGRGMAPGHGPAGTGPVPAAPPGTVTHPMARSGHEPGPGPRASAPDRAASPAPESARRPAGDAGPTRPVPLANPEAMTTDPRPLGNPAPGSSAPQGPTAPQGRARLCVLWMGAPVPLSEVRGRVELGPVPARRGADVSGTLEAAFSVGNETVRVKGRLRTFVRDVVPSDWLTGSCAELLAARTKRAPGTEPGRPGGEDRPPCYFVAHWDGLTQMGYRAYGLRPGGACARMGLRENDVVTAARGKPLRAWSDVTALYDLLGGEGPLALAVRREGRTLTLKRR